MSYGGKGHCLMSAHDEMASVSNMLSSPNRCENYILKYNYAVTKYNVNLQVGLVCYSVATFIREYG